MDSEVIEWMLQSRRLAHDSPIYPSPLVTNSVSAFGGFTSWWPVERGAGTRGEVNSRGAGRGRLTGEERIPLVYMWMGLLNPVLGKGNKVTVIQHGHPTSAAVYSPSFLLLGTPRYLCSIKPISEDRR